MEHHPDAFEEAKGYEKTALVHGSPFTWSQGESLEELSQPERIATIRSDHERRVARTLAKKQHNPLKSEYEPLDLDELYGKSKVCLACHK